MSNTYISNIMHCVFSTKRRQKLIKPEIKQPIWEFIGGIAKQNRAKMLAIGGTEDHIHLLVSLPSTMSIAKAMNLMKGASSKWVHDNFPGYKEFQWQDGYGAFSVSLSNVASVIAYINNQEQHHKKKTFEEEFVVFLNKHSIEYDELYVLG